MFDWLTREMQERGWSQRELARRANINYATVSKAMSDQGRVTFNFCAAIARPLGKDPVEVFRIAGLLPASGGKLSELTREEGELIELYRQLQEEYRVAQLETVRGLVIRVGKKKR
jgi:transcriptional regulator with XRE-family HTH domain